MTAAQTPPQPLVTAVIPAYKAAGFIRNAVDSILAQTHQNVEIIIVDDCSPDDTEAVARQIAHPRLTVLRQSVNQGVAAARNRALAQACGEYIAFLDADDVWLPDHLEQALKWLSAHPQLDVLIQDSDIVDLRNGEHLGSWFQRHTPALKALATRPLGPNCLQIEGRFMESLMTSCFVHVQSLVARRHVFDTTLFDENLRCSEDLDWALRSVYEGRHTWAWHDRMTGLYHRHDDSLTAPSPDKHERIELIGIMLYTRYLQWPGLTPQDVQAIHLRMLDSLMELSYFARQKKAPVQAWRHWLHSWSHGQSARQLKELPKLLVSTLLRPLQRT